MVQQFYSEEEIIKRFEDNLALLRQEAKRCDDSFKIYLCWQDAIGRELNQQYTPDELLDLHGQSRSTIIRKEIIYTIIEGEETVAKFYYCKHLMYTPIRSDYSKNHCLRC